MNRTVSAAAAGGRVSALGGAGGSRAITTLLSCAGLSLALGACGGAGGAASTQSSRNPGQPVSQPGRQVSTRVVPEGHPKPLPPSYPIVIGAARGTRPSGFVPAVVVRGRPAAWIARSPDGTALLSFDQGLVGLVLHSGTVDAGASGWRWGPVVAGSERARVVAAFNGAFKLSTGAGGFFSYGRTAAPLRSGLASIVTYADGSTDIGSWHQEVPAPARAVVSVRQNLTMLIDHGVAAPTLGCLDCWGATLGGASAPARSALGITADGRLIWAGGEHLTVSSLAGALLAARVVRAAELDINPEWVAGYLYEHHGAGRPVVPIPVLTQQPGVSGQFLAPDGRDFFAVVARS